MAGFFKGLLRANAANYGDLEGSMTGLQSGKRSVTVEKGKCIAWIVGEDDIELSKENVLSLEPIATQVTINDLASGGGKPYVVNTYLIKMKNGQSGMLRLLINSAFKVLALLQ